MRKVTLDELRTMGEGAKGKIDKIYLHWTAGYYHSFFTDYHVSIDSDGSIWVSTDDLTQRKNHTWHRNGRAIGIALCCCIDASCRADGRVDFGTVPPTEAQIDGMAKAVAVLAETLGLEVDASAVMTHCEAAELDSYGPSTTCERWDLWKLPDYPSGVIKDGGKVVRGKAIWWQHHM